MNAPPVDFLKIDVQGYEHHALRGMAKLLDRNRQLAVLTEFWPHGIREAGGDPDEYLRRFADHDFRAFVFDSEVDEHEVAIENLMNLVPPFDPAEPDGSFLNVLFRRF